MYLVYVEWGNGSCFNYNISLGTYYSLRERAPVDFHEKVVKGEGGLKLGGAQPRPRRPRPVRIST